MGKHKSPKTETERQKQAFEYYYALGSKRKYRLVADEFNVSPSTIKNWSRDFKWRQRLEERDAEFTKAISDKAKSDSADQLERSLKMLDLVLTKGAKDLLGGQSKSTPSNILKAVDTKMRLLEKMQELVEAKRKRAPNLPVLVMIDNGRGDCTLPLATGLNSKTEGDTDRAGDTDNG